MAGFNFERNLPHQERAVTSLLSVLENVGAKKCDNALMANVSNPIIEMDKSRFYENLCKVQRTNDISQKFQNLKSRVLDISMETGTGKTYTYTKMMFELHKNLGVSKFIIVVPTLSIKAGTLSFLKSLGVREHFRSEYDAEIKTYLVESKKSGKKNKKSMMPQAVKAFVEAHSQGGKSLHVMVINSGMLNSDTMSKAVDVTLFDKYNTPFEGIASIKPFTIVDEPHKFAQGNVSWENIQKFCSQFIVRFGATFDEKYENLIYKLTAVDAFNDDLVKGVVTHVETFESGENSFVTLKSTDGKEAVFELHSEGKKREFTVAHKGSLSVIHAEMQGLNIENMNKSVVVLSNGLEMKRGDKINPYSFSQSVQDGMMAKAIVKHFEIEKALLSREVKIKPLTLFFIDDIAGYRVEEHQISGSLKEKFERMVKAHAAKLLEDETNPFYKSYLEKTVQNIALTHGGYFSKDNSESDEKIEKEIQEILHDKESLLSLDNPRRFIFSKWTLREGWDNPNVFQICKLRSSGSKTSKLQEVGRGLRLPVNEYMSRVKDEKFDLHYYVDFSEKAFVDELVGEINKTSGSICEVAPIKLSDGTIKMIVFKYGIDEDTLLEKLDELGIVKRNNDFKEGGYETLKTMFPDAFMDGLKKDKVRSGDTEKPKVHFKVGKYAELKELWETINQKVILEYKIENETAFFELLKAYFIEHKTRFKPQGVETKISKIGIKEGMAFYTHEQSTTSEIVPISTMSYAVFLSELAQMMSINITTLNRVFIAIQAELDINLYRNVQTIRAIKSGFDKFLLDSSFNKFSVSYTKISNEIHPTKFTDKKGNPLESINASDVGVHFSSDRVAENYLFEELFYDSDLEKENIKSTITDVTVFTKIPKSSIRIPVAGGGTYSPDFAYVIKHANGDKKLHLVVETKNKEERDLQREEEQKIKHAEKLFGNHVKIAFKTQFKDDEIKEIIKEAIVSSHLELPNNC
ncbi:MAG: type III restriction-modification system endonuclease [Sulfurospirillaceae bacterium]|nr:type III restriction-modification system endonuclease [Sulfurospirillaceae bacterium]